MELDELLVNKDRLVVDNDVGIQGTVFWFAFDGLSVGQVRTEED